MQCMQCGDPPCLPVCPTTATKQREDGIVWVDYGLCIGCGYCVVACPYRARHVVKRAEGYFEAPTPPEERAAGGSSEFVGVCTKCTFCMERIDRATDGARPGVDPEVTPVCSSSCIANAIHFGDLDDPESAVSRLVRENRVVRLLEELGTDPAVYYIVGER
jgi:phenylacetyl-CoA:acceptor oxidoreductase subunit 1